MNPRYAAVLDIFALVSTYPTEARVLREATQVTALAYIRGEATASDVRLLLFLARDLGYASEELIEAHQSFL